MTAAQFLAGMWRQPLYRAGHVLVSAVRSRLVRSGRAGVPGPAVRAALASTGRQSERPVPTVSDTAVIMVRAAQDDASVLKVATSPGGAASLRREHDNLSRLCSDERLGAWRALLPVPLQAGDAGDGAFLLISRLPGQDARRVAPERVSHLTMAAVEAIAPLHRLAATVHPVDAELLHQLVDEPAERLRKAVHGNGAIDRLVAALHTQLAGRWVTLGWTHGDFAPGNVLVGTDEQVTGIIDWSQVREHDLVLLDLAFWLLTVPAPGRRREFGAGVAARLRGGRPWLPAEHRLLAGWMDPEPLSGRVLLLLAWLRHVTDNLAKSDRYLASPLWSRRNVAPVMRWVAELDPAAGGWS